MPNEVFIEEKNYLTALQLALGLSSDNDIHDILRCITNHEEDMENATKLLAQYTQQMKALKAEVERMRAYINRNDDDQGTYCAFCFERYPLDNDAAEQAQAHILTCPKHPMRKLEGELKQLRDYLFRRMWLL